MGKMTPEELNESYKKIFENFDPKKAAENLEKSMNDELLYIKKSQEEFKDAVKNLEGIVLEVHQIEKSKKEYQGDPYNWVIGSKIPYIEIKYFESTLKVLSDEKEYSFFYNGPLDSLRKGDEVKLSIYSFEEKEIAYKFHGSVCIPRELKSGDEIFKIRSESAGIIFESVPKNKPYMKKERKY